MGSTPGDSTEEDAIDTVDALTRSLRRVRAAQLDEIHAAVAARSWAHAGFRSPTDWLAVVSREAFGSCKLSVHLADRIRHMPQVKAAFAAGDLAESALRALADSWSESNASAFARDEGMLLGWVLRLPHRDLRMLLDSWQRHADAETESAADDDRFRSRTLSIVEQRDGSGRIDGTLDREGLAVVREAIRALSGRTADDRRRTVVSTETIRRLACDAGIHRHIHGPDGTTLDHGRRTRTVSDALFDQLVTRDHGCRVPGCPVGPSACDAHHAVHWTDLGPTELDNLILACWYHHHLLHEQHWRIQPLGAGHFTLIDPTGRTHEMRPPMVGLALPVA